MSQKGLINPTKMRWTLQPYRWAFLHPAKRVPGARIGWDHPILVCAACRAHKWLQYDTPGGVS